MIPKSGLLSLVVHSVTEGNAFTVGVINMTVEKTKLHIHRPYGYLQSSNRWHGSTFCVLG